MFIDTSAVVAILTEEPEAAEFLDRMARAPVRLTSALVILETVMRLSTKLAIDPMRVEPLVERFMQEAGIDLAPMDANAARFAVKAFADYGKGRGHPAQLNLADCLSYGCAKAQGVPLLYKGDDFARTDLAGWGRK
jgi:ribonuclease VapC